MARSASSKLQDSHRSTTLAHLTCALILHAIKVTGSKTVGHHPMGSYSKLQEGNEKLNNSKLFLNSQCTQIDSKIKHAMN